MSEQLDDLYLDWLYSQVASTERKAKTQTFWCLMRQLFHKEFVWFVPNDDNRVQDGRDLRYRFVEERHVPNVERGWFEQGCSMLELCISLAQTLAFEDMRGRSTKFWFWQLMENVGLEQCTDAQYREETDARVDDILDRIIFRTYEGTGRGGLFPLRDPSQDQREVELWYQLCAYLLQDD